jgi:hypothetical protein
LRCTAAPRIRRRGPGTRSWPDASRKCSTRPALIKQINGADNENSHLFRADITELVVVRLAEPADHLVVESWHEGKGVTRRERR